MRYLYATTKWLLTAGAIRITFLDRVIKGLCAPVAGTVLFLFLFIVPGPAAPLSAAEPALPAFGEGPVEVRVYTDYFCGACGAEEREVMAVIAELVAKNRIRIVFIDTPLYPETVLYGEYFLAALNAKREFGQALAARAALFEAAGLKIREKGKLESFLAKKGLEIQPFDAYPVFELFSKKIKEDRVSSTPTVVILGPQGKQVLGNKEQILTALRGLRK